LNLITIEVVYAQADEQQLVSVSVEEGTQARTALLQVLEQSAITLSASDAQLAQNEIPIGVYGVIVDDEYELRAGDRLEIYRPLVQDPMERRRRVARTLE